MRILLAARVPHRVHLAMLSPAFAQPGHWERDHRGPAASHRDGHDQHDRRDAHRLPAPRRGYHRIEVGSDFVLVANRTGVIVQVRLG